MNILIDLRWMAIGQAGGMEQAAFELVAAIAGVNHRDRFYLFCPRRTFEEWVFPSGFKGGPVFSDVFDLVPEVSTYNLGESSAERKSRRLGIVEKGGAEPSSRVKVLDIDLVHSVRGFVSENLLGYPRVVTFYDLQHRHFPSFFSEADIELREKRNRASFAAASRVVCISEFVREDVCREYDLDSCKTSAVWIIPSGHAWLEVSDSFARKALRRLGIESEFLFFPAHCWEHKNHRRLVEAFALVKERYSDELLLVFTGSPFEEDHPALDAIAELGLGESVRHLGFRTPMEVRCLFQRAEALVFPSLFEGFGLPVAEAIIVGTPVVCSDIEPLVEVGGDAVVTFDPEDANDMAEKILYTLVNQELRVALRGKALVRKQVFSAETIALKMCNLYREVVGEEPISTSSSVAPPSVRYEQARHFKRLCEEAFERGNWANGLWNLLLAGARSPRMGWSRLRRLASPREWREPSPFVGRFEDGWIGPKFRDYLFAPEGARELEVVLESPLSIEGKAVLVELEMDDAARLEVEVGQNGQQSFRIGIPDGAVEVVSFEISCDRSFVPKELGHSEDERELSLKLVGIRWSG